MKLHLYFSIFILLVSFTAKSQTLPSWYLVSFKDKANSPYSISNPGIYLSQRAIERRIKNHIKIDSSDFPVNPSYIDSLVYYDVEATYQSRWLNAALVYVDDSTKINKLTQSSIIDSIAYMSPFLSLKKRFKKNKRVSETMETDFSTNNISTYSETTNRIHSIGLQSLMDKGYKGKGIWIAILDNGFNNVDKIAAFKHLYDNGQILGTHNFSTDGKQIYNSGSHGTMVLSTMAGYIKHQFVGSAIDADYYLLQTEDNRAEYPVEEANWLFGAEYADSVGVDIITSSLVYTQFDDNSLNQNITQLDGKTSIVSRAAQMAATKGIIVFNSAGNEGLSPWRKICFPADAKDVISVAAVGKDDEIAAFSSHGYSSDKRVKPDLAARGEYVAVINAKGNIVRVNGTSFSTPFLAGATASLMQATPNKTANELRQSLKESARQFMNPDSLYGYGIPNIYLAAILLNVDSITPIELTNDPLVIPNPFEDNLHIVFNTIDSQEISISIFDLSGKEIWHRENISSISGNNIFFINNISSFAQGVYAIKIKIGNTLYTKKIIKK